MTKVLRPLPADEFVRLAVKSGLDISADDLEQLARRRLLQPFESGSYSRLHLYVLALYFDAIRVCRHPWAMRQPNRTLEDVKSSSASVQEVALKLESAQFSQGLSGAVSELALDVERFIAEIDPFGPIADIIDVVRADVIEKLRGPGRLYAELRATASALAVRSEELDESLLDPQTREVPAEEIGPPKGEYPLGDLSGLTDGLDADGGFDALTRGPMTREIPLDEAELDEIDELAAELSDAVSQELDLGEVSDPDGSEATEDESAADEAEESETTNDSPTVRKESALSNLRASLQQKVGEPVAAPAEDGELEHDSDAIEEDELSEASDAEDEDELGETAEGDNEAAAAVDVEEPVEEESSEPSEPVNEEAEELDEEDESEEPVDDSEAEEDGDAEESDDAPDADEDHAEESGVDEEESDAEDEDSDAADEDSDAEDEDSDAEDEDEDSDAEDEDSDAEEDEDSDAEDSDAEQDSDAEEDGDADEDSDAEEDSDDADEDGEEEDGDAEDEPSAAPDAIAPADPDDTGEMAPASLEEDSEDFRITSEVEASSRDDESKPNPFSREPSTGRTKALLERLEEIKAQKSDDAPEDEESEGSDADAAPAKNLEEKVNELNQLREQLIREQDWSGLVKLYEERIDLFEAPSDRQQVFLTLATLYELKLSDHENAFASFSKAFELEVESGRKKTLDSLRKIGARDEVLPGYIEWLETHVHTIDGPLRAEMQHDLANAHRSAGQEQRAFLTFAAYLAEDPDRADAAALDLLDELSLAVGDEELGEFYNDVLEEESGAESRALIGHRAGSFFQSCNRPEEAIVAFRVAFDADPTSVLAFSSLTRLYEKAERWSDLRGLIAEKLKTAEGDEAARLRKELGRVVQNENSSTDIITQSTETLADDPNDDHALEQLVEAYGAESRFTDAYAHLNRLLDSSPEAAQEVRIRQHLAQIAMDHLESPEEASHHLENALSISGPNREVLEALANVRLGSGDWEEAVSTVRMLTGGGVTLPTASMRKWLNAGIEAARNANNPDDVRRFQEQLQRESEGA